jgi:hypothetical protein
MIPIAAKLLKDNPIIPIATVGGLGFGVYYLWKNFNPLALAGKGLSAVTALPGKAWKTGKQGVFGAGKSAFKGVKSIKKDIFKLGKKSKKYVPAVKVFNVGKKLTKSPKAKKVARKLNKRTKKYRSKARKSSKKARKMLKKLKW